MYSGARGRCILKLTKDSFLVIFPAIAQKLVDLQELRLVEASLLAPSPDAITFSLNSTITVPKPFTVVLDPLNLSLFVRGVQPEQPYVYLELPETKLHGNASIILEPQRAKIVSQTQWLAFLNNSVYSQQLTLAAKGKTTGHFGKIKAPLTLDKNVQINGTHSYTWNNPHIILMFLRPQST